jgi:5-methyltetrahydropteroyltriglutamate--homocysteine methyltransferase
MVRTTVVNSYPKISSVRGEVNLRNAINRYESGKISDTDLEQAYRETIKRTIREQQEAGLDLITDGMIRWDDLVSPFCVHIENMNRGALLRFFDNNVYYRRPTLDGQLSISSPTSVEDFLFSSQTSTVPIKAVLPGPVTFRDMCEDKHYFDDKKLFAEIEKVLQGEISALTAAGCRCIQFDEPSLPFHPEWAEKSTAIINRLSQARDFQSWVYFYFASLYPIASILSEYRVSVIGADCRSHADNMNILMDSGTGCDFCFGIVDARDLKLETKQDLISGIREIADRVNGRDFWVSPSCSLEFLPQDYALRKLNLLTDAARAFNQDG